MADGNYARKTFTVLERTRRVRMSEQKILSMYIPLEQFEIILGNVHIHIERYNKSGIEGVEILCSDNAYMVKNINTNKVLVLEKENYGRESTTGN